MVIDNAEHLLTVYDGNSNHKSIFWDTYDSGKTVSLSIVDRFESSKTAIDVLNLNAWELGELIAQLKDLESQMHDVKKHHPDGEEIHST